MKRINENNLKELAAVHGLHCISVFIPTHIPGDKGLREGDSLLLKNELKDIKRKLAARGLAQPGLDEWVKPIQNLVDDSEFWSRQAGGLALFISDNTFKKYELDINFEPYNYVSTEFYIKPLFSALATNEDFFLLTLELEEVKLHKGSEAGLQEIDITEMVPSGLEEVVGSDYEQKSSQFKSQQKGHGYSVYYGHGEGKEENKTEINKYLRKVNKGITKLLKNEKVPLVVAGVDYLVSAYREVTSLDNLYERHIPGNPKLLGLESLHKRALDLLQPYFNKTKKEKTEVFRQFQGTPKTANNIDDIVPEAMHGKIDTLFMLKDQDVFGMVDEVSDQVEYKEGAELAEVSLFNLAAKEAFLHGGNVYLVEQEEMPDGFSIINALYRY
jgi:hypothetical protein